MDPRVLLARADEPIDGPGRKIDAASANIIMVRGRDREHVLVDLGSLVRLDIVTGTTAAGPVSLCFEIADDARVEHQIAAIRALRDPHMLVRGNRRLARRLASLCAVDARADGASLREIADTLIGPGDWPGDGEHRKSRVRRLLADGWNTVALGPRAILVASG